MSDKEIIKTTIDALGIDDLATDDEKAQAKKPKKIDLTSELVSAVVALLRTGASLREIKRTVIAPGPKGQKWKLSNAQIREIAGYRAVRYGELTAPTEDNDEQ